MPAVEQNINGLKELSRSEASAPEGIEGWLYSAKIEAIREITAGYCQKYFFPEASSGTLIQSIKKEYNIDQQDENSSDPLIEPERFKEYVEKHFFFVFMQKFYHSFPEGELEKFFQLSLAGLSQKEKEEQTLCALIKWLESKKIIQGYVFEREEEKNEKILKYTVVLYNQPYIRYEGKNSYKPMVKDLDLSKRIDPEVGMELVTYARVGSIDSAESLIDFLNNKDILLQKKFLQVFKSKLSGFIVSAGLNKGLELLHYLPPNLRTFVFKKIKQTIIDRLRADQVRLINMESIFKYFKPEERAEIFQEISPGTLLKLIKENGVLLSQILTYLTHEERRRLLTVAEDQFPDKDLEPESLPKLLAYLSREQIKKLGKFIREKKKLHVSFDVISWQDLSDALQEIAAIDKGNFLLSGFLERTIEKYRVDFLSEIARDKIKLRRFSDVENLPVFLSKIRREERDIIFNAIEFKLHDIGRENPGLLLKILGYFTHEQIEHYNNPHTGRLYNIEAQETEIKNWGEVKTCLKNRNEEEGVAWLIKNKKKLRDLSGVAILPDLLKRLNREQRNIIFKALEKEFLPSLLTSSSYQIHLLIQIFRYLTTEQIRQLYSQNKALFLGAVDPEFEDWKARFEELARYLPFESRKELASKIQSDSKKNILYRSEFQGGTLFVSPNKVGRLDSIPMYVEMNNLSSQQFNSQMKHFKDIREEIFKENKGKFREIYDRVIYDIDNSLNKFVLILEYLSHEQREIVLNELTEQLNDLDAKRFNELMSILTESERDFIFVKIIKGECSIVRRSGIYTVQEFCLMSEYFTKEQRSWIYNHYRSQLLASTKRFAELVEVLACVPLEWKNDFFGVFEEQLLFLIKEDFTSSVKEARKHFDKFCEALEQEQKDKVYVLIRDHWQEIIFAPKEFRDKESKRNHEDAVAYMLGLFMRMMTNQQKEEFFKLYGDVLPGVIKTAYHLESIFKSLTDAQKEIVFEKIYYRLFEILKKRYNKPLPDPFSKNEASDFKIENTTGYKIQSALRYLNLRQCAILCEMLNTASPQIINNIEDLAVLVYGLESERVEIVLDSFKYKMIELIEDYLACWHDDTLKTARKEVHDFLDKLVKYFEEKYEELHKKDPKPPFFKTNLVEKIRNKSLNEKITTICEHIKNPASRSAETWQSLPRFYSHKERMGCISVDTLSSTSDLSSGRSSAATTPRNGI